MTSGSSPIGTSALALQPGAPVRISCNVQNRTNQAALMIISGVLASSLTYLILGFGYAVVLFTAVVIVTGCYYFTPQEGETEEHSTVFGTLQYIFCGAWLTAVFNEIFRAFRSAPPSSNRNYRLTERKCPMSGRYRPGTTATLPSNHPPIAQGHIPYNSTRYGPTYWEQKRSGTSNFHRGEVQETHSVPSTIGQVQEEQLTAWEEDYPSPSPSPLGDYFQTTGSQSFNRRFHTEPRGALSRGRGNSSTRGRGTSSTRGRGTSSTRGRN